MRLDYVPGTTLGAREVAVTKANPATTVQNLYVRPPVPQALTKGWGKSHGRRSVGSVAEAKCLSSHSSAFRHVSAPYIWCAYVINFDQRHVSRSAVSL